MRAFRKTPTSSRPSSGSKTFRAKEKPGVESLTKRLDDLCADIEQTNPAADCLGGWKTFFEADIDSDEPIPHLLHALDKAFGYRTYADSEMKQAEVDDLATRKIAWERAGAFCEHENEVRAAHRYSKLQPSGESALADLHDKLKSLRKRLGKLEDLLDRRPNSKPGARPVGQHPRHLQNPVSASLRPGDGQVRSGAPGCRAIAIGGGFRGLGTLGKDRRLPSGIDHAGLARPVGTRGGRPVRHGTGPEPGGTGGAGTAIPEGCPLQVDEADQYIEQAETAKRQAIALVRGVLVAAAKLLQQPACEAC